MGQRKPSPGKADTALDNISSISIDTGSSESVVLRRAHQRTHWLLPQPSKRQEGKQFGNWSQYFLKGTANRADSQVKGPISYKPEVGKRHWSAMLLLRGKTKLDTRTYVLNQRQGFGLFTEERVHASWDT